MKELNCIVVDDEPMALDLIESYVLKTPFLKLAGKCNNAFEAMQLLKEENIDLIFMDIQMPDLNGLDFSRTLKGKARLIFTTAFDQYAIEGYKVDALDYLLKPFDYTEFLAAASKALDWYQITERNNQDSGGERKPAKEYLFVRSEYRQLKIRIDDILYFEGLKDYIKIYLKDQQKPILTLKSLKSIFEELPEKRFMRIHRSFVIALDKIDEIERNQVVIQGKRITVSESYRDDFQEYISKNSF
ncbi:LytR/AlgR family response regulator transcription factor [Robertkochia solimangrovi]|uniref:LytR/AlgR family response regulator transcription factor n=1 Tax=Robertkochia solimangrovi TaxID=2213046 RepID=UPI00117D5620|nr:LytTR family DNA-binding domain-containing protein [Robertkochia solimangrovi]TRZ42150.1 DNA-binding response regulator [Robertkochia solimangrovi]